MSGSGREALPNVREWSGGPPRCPGVVVKPSRMSGRPVRMSGSGREAIPDAQETISDIREWLVGPPGCPGVVWRP